MTDMNSRMEMDWTPVMHLGNMSLVPHYTKPDMWALPGRTEDDKPRFATTSELLARGATRGTTLLWPRLWTKGLQ
jgi:hypothetical protein